MWTNKQGVSTLPGTSTIPEPGRSPAASSPADFHRSSSLGARPTAWLGPGLVLKGELSGNEDLFVDSTIEGPVSLGGNRLTIGHRGNVKGEVVAREVIVQGKIQGDVRSHDRVEIKKDGSLVGDLTTARIVIEDGAYFKGSIEIDRESKPIGTDLEGLLARTAPKETA
ncbi:MAG: polymer-forming cytoskeletal protein [Candidatus Acidiferrales bacterium]